MKTHKILSLILLTCAALSLPAFASNPKQIECKNFQGFTEVKQKINLLNHKFDWNNSNCKIVGTTSIFPRKDKSGKFQYEKGLQLFVYQDDQLKFICLPGWICKSWNAQAA